MLLIITTLVKLRLNLLNLLRQTFSVMHSLNCFYQKYSTYIVRRIDDIFLRYFVTFINASCRWVVGLTVFLQSQILLSKREGGGRKRERMEGKDT